MMMIKPYVSDFHPSVIDKKQPRAYIKFTSNPMLKPRMKKPFIAMITLTLTMEALIP